MNVDEVVVVVVVVVVAGDIGSVKWERLWLELVDWFPRANDRLA